MKQPFVYLSRNFIHKSIKYLVWIAVLAILWVMLEYIFIGSSRSIPIIKTIKIHTSEFNQNGVKIVQHQQIPFVLVYRSDADVRRLKQQYQDTDNALRSLSDKHFIALAIGTNYGCIVAQYQTKLLKETCSSAVYDFTGRSLSNEHKALTVPPMTFDKTTRIFNLTLK